VALRLLVSTDPPLFPNGYMLFFDFSLRLNHFALALAAVLNGLTLLAEFGFLLDAFVF